MRIAIYARYSSDLQNPNSAQDQIDAIKAAIERMGNDWRVVTTERDEAVSGTSLEGRDGLKRLLAEATKRPRRFDVVVVEDISRVARNRFDAISIRQQFTAEGVQVLSAADGFIDPDSEGGMFMTAIKEAKAELDSRETARRTRRGIAARTREGWLSGRPTPFGYARDPVFSESETDCDGQPKRLGSRLKPDPIKADIVRYVFDRYSVAVGLRRIASTLNTPGSTSRAIKPEGYAPSFLRSLLLNPVYLGHVVYGRTRENKVREPGRVKRRKVKVAPEDWVIAKNRHEALVDQETWDRVQERFKVNKRIGKGGSGSRGGRKPASVLSGLIRCAVCGSNFVVCVSTPNNRQRERGTGRRNRRCGCNKAQTSRGELCSNRDKASVDRLEAATLDAIENVVLTPEGLAELERQRAAYLGEALSASQQDVERLRAEERQLRAKEARLIAAITEGVALPGLHEKAREIGDRLAQVRTSLDRVEALEAASNRRVEAHLAANPVRHLRDVLDAPDLDEVRAALLAARADATPEVTALHPQPGRSADARPWGEVIARTFKPRG